MGEGKQNLIQMQRSLKAQLDLPTSPTVADHSHRRKRRYEQICIDCLICLDKREYTKDLPTNFKSLPAWGLLGACLSKGFWSSKTKRISQTIIDSCFTRILFVRTCF